MIMVNFQKTERLHDVGKMTRRTGKRNRGRAILAIVCALMMFMAAGCGKAEEPVPVDLSSGDMEELQNETAEDTGADSVSGKDENGMENDEAEGADADTDEEDSAENVTPEKAGENADGEGVGSASKDGAQAQSAGSMELEGNVLSVGGDSFVVSRIETYTDGDASYAVGVAPGYEEEEDRITVHVSEGCFWEFQTVKNGGINPEDVSVREGSFADLEEGISTRMKGSWQDDGSFLADSIVMSIFK